MLCPQCRQPIPDGSRFCNLCGTAIQTMVPVQGSSSMVNQEEEVTLAVLHPSFLFVGVRYAGAVVATIAFVLLGAFVAAQSWPYISAAAPWAVVVLSILAFGNPIYHHIRRQMETYTITNQKVEIQTGLLSRTTRKIPIHKIQDVTTQATLLGRLLGIGSVLIDSASESGKITLKNIPKPQMVSDEIVRYLKK